MTDGIRCVILRGGTSKGIYLRAADLPTDASEREASLLRIFGSPDKRQIDELGGADPLTSKVCVISPPDAHAKALGADLTYTFGQVELEEPVVDLRSLCATLTSGVGAFAIWESIVVPQEAITTVRSYNTNLERMLV
jgi:2-methylaconitate cis-trans-isomerase PrpF